MIHYYSRIPAAAVKQYPDGHKYAYVPHRVVGMPGTPSDRVIEDYDNPRLLRVDHHSIFEQGECHVWFASRGDKLPIGGYVPQSVMVRHVKD